MCLLNNPSPSRTYSGVNALVFIRPFWATWRTSRRIPRWPNVVISRPSWIRIPVTISIRRECYSSRCMPPSIRCNDWRSRASSTPSGRRNPSRSIMTSSATACAGLQTRTSQHLPFATLMEEWIRVRIGKTMAYDYIAEFYFLMDVQKAIIICFIYSTY